MLSGILTRLLSQKKLLLLTGVGIYAIIGGAALTAHHLLASSTAKNGQSVTLATSKSTGSDIKTATEKGSTASAQKTAETPKTTSTTPTGTTSKQSTKSSAAVASSGSSGSSAPATPPSQPAAPAGPMYFSTVASGQCLRSGGCSSSTGLPRSDSYCSANVTATTWEPRADNYTANHTQGPADPTTISWGVNAITNYWTNNDTNVRKVDGFYTGNTTQIIQWASCKWGIDEDLIRAVAVQESDWHQNTVGDSANGCAHSFSIIQVRDSTNSACPINHNAYGGMPFTQNSTALALDFYGAIFRTCYDGDFYDGGPWLYGGQTVAQVAAAHDWDYVKWGCVGAWFSGDWYSSGAQNYINLVKSHLTNHVWTTY